jgi:hypothetical protein
MLVYINGIDYPASNRMKITSIKQQVKNAERVSVFVDGKYTFSLSLDELLAHKLKTNDELGAHDVKKFKKISADGKLRARALEWLMSRPRSEREFRDYLYRKKAETEQIENLVNEFSKKVIWTMKNLRPGLRNFRQDAAKATALFVLSCLRRESAGN